jgi:hypothetical protein
MSRASVRAKNAQQTANRAGSQIETANALTIASDFRNRRGDVYFSDSTELTGRSKALSSVHL